jgi:hypothetical protein
MPKLAPQNISQMASDWVAKEAIKLNVSRAEIVRRLLDAAAIKG